MGPNVPPFIPCITDAHVVIMVEVASQAIAALATNRGLVQLCETNRGRARLIKVNLWEGAYGVAKKQHSQVHQAGWHTNPLRGDNVAQTKKGKPSPHNGILQSLGKNGRNGDMHRLPGIARQELAHTCTQQLYLTCPSHEPAPGTKPPSTPSSTNETAKDAQVHEKTSSRTHGHARIIIIESFCSPASSWDGNALDAHSHRQQDAGSSSLACA
eukprot:1151392-Pelagomonas_calceolata.AAC.4